MEKIKIWACGFDDQMPCARNKYNLGIGATLFIREEDALQFIQDKVIGMHELTVNSDVQLVGLIARHRSLTASHLASLGYSDDYIAASLELFDQRTK